MHDILKYLEKCFEFDAGKYASEALNEQVVKRDLDPSMGGSRILEIIGDLKRDSNRIPLVPLFVTN